MGVSNHPFLAVQFISFLLTTSCCPMQVVSVKHNNFTDYTALVAFKANIGDPYGILSSNWTSNTSFCSWNGVQCSKQRQRVVALKFSGLPLQGTITPLLSNLSFMQLLYLGNNSLTGSIPYTLGLLPRLRFLNLAGNQLTGSIPPSIFNMSSLLKLSLASNNLSGMLPGNDTPIALPQLQWISLAYNNFISGQIPLSFAQCEDLQLLSLSTNRFSGVIPAQLGNLVELRVLFLDDNSLTGSVPSSLGNLTKLNQLDLSVNNLVGEIPPMLGSLLNLQWLSLAHNGLTGQIPLSLANASMISALDLSINNITGHVPVELGKLRFLEYLLLGWNRLQGPLDFITSLSNCRSLVNLHFLHNELNGVLPVSIGNLSTSLQKLTARANHMRGNIPAELNNLSSLLLLNLHSNELTGIIPSEITRLSMLQAFYVGFNKLSGTIPQEIGRMSSLSQLSMEENSLSGSIPYSTGNITGLQNLWLGTNALSSSIPETVWSLRGLNRLYLSQNSLQGRLSPAVGNLNALVSLDLSSNQLAGSIPNALGGLQMLQSLDLSNNSFLGLIPESLGGLLSIESLNLSSNSLSGTIPKSLATLRYLSGLNLSFNKLEGNVPAGGIFSNITRESLVGNSALCGASLLGFSPCPEESASSKSTKKQHLLKFIIPSISVAISLVACCLFLLIFKLKRRIISTVSINTLYQNNYRLISYQELRHATDNFNEANFLGRGRFGSVFKGQLADGLVVAIKVLNLQIDGASRSFEAECHALRMVRHRNLIKVINICSSPDFKALILQYMSNGSLESWLHSENYFLSLIQRVNIMLDVALALEYLHHHHPQLVIHCDLKPSNVLLNEEMTAHLSDFGIAKLLNCDSKSVSLASTPGTFGYIAPEYGLTGKISRMGDVYSFGILLLETFTRKRPTDAMFHGELSLRQWVSDAHSSSTSAILDCSLLREEYSEGTPNIDLDAKNQCLLSMMELGLICSSDSPTNRILMKDVVPKIQKIKMDCLSRVS